MTNDTIAVLGLGAMGSRMARRLIDAGYSVRGYNRSAPARDALAAAGAACFDTPRRAAAGAGVVISMVTDDEAARAVWLDPDAGALGALTAGTVAIESSTVTPSWVRALAEQVSATGAVLLDAPVAGSRPQAEAGQLIYLVGGAADALAQVRPILEVMGSTVHHAGGTGAGAVVKLIVNALFGVQIAALSELLGLAQSAGIAPADAVALLRELPVTSPAVAGAGSLIAAGQFAPMFPIDLVEKDLRYAVATAPAAPVTEATRAAYDAARSAGLGGLNIAAIAKLYVT